MCVRGTDFASFNDSFYWVFELFRQCGIFVFVFFFHFIFMAITEDVGKKNEALQIDKKNETKNRPLWLH
jgi:hypothetical protein